MMETKDYFKGLGIQFAKDYGEFLKLIPECSSYNSNEISQIYKALHKAMELHDGQMRKSGEPYINHPIGAASILARYGLDFEVICAALLHDTIEDTEYTLEECEKDFGSRIMGLVDGATKIGRNVNRMTHEKIIRSMKADARSFAVKAGDRLHNMYTLYHLKEEKQKEIATETNVFYVPIVKILGIYKLKDEFQDLCLYYLNNEQFLKYYELRNYLKDKYDEVLRNVGDKTQDLLSTDGIAMKYDYRVKNVGGIYYDVQRGLAVNDIKDLLAIKMVLSDISMCYKTLDKVYLFCTPEKKEIDFIANPKSNGYQSLNTNVKYKDSDIQVRIRTCEMQGKNNLGVFSNWTDETQARINGNMSKSIDALAKKLRQNNK